MEEAFASNPVQDIHAYCIADAINLAGEPEQLNQTARRLRNGNGGESGARIVRGCKRCLQPLEYKVLWEML